MWNKKRSILGDCYHYFGCNSSDLCDCDSDDGSKVKKEGKKRWKLDKISKLFFRK